MPENEKSLKCVPSSVELYLYHSTRVRIKTSDQAQGVRITALGYNSVVSVDPTEEDTGSSGYLDGTVKCEGCGYTTVTFDAPSYEPCSIDVDCVDPTASFRVGQEQMAFAIVPIQLSSRASPSLPVGLPIAKMPPLEKHKAHPPSQGKNVDKMAGCG